MMLAPREMDIVAVSCACVLVPCLHCGGDVFSDLLSMLSCTGTIEVLQLVQNTTDERRPASSSLAEHK
jgi:hypothetical protein